MHNNNYLITEVYLGEANTASMNSFCFFNDLFQL